MLINTDHLYAYCRLCSGMTHRVMVACRDGRLYSLKEGDVRGTAVLTGTVIDLGAQAVAMAREDKVCMVD